MPITRKLEVAPAAWLTTNWARRPSGKRMSPAAVASTPSKRVSPLST